MAGYLGLHKEAQPLTAGEWAGGGYNPLNWLSRGTDAAFGPASQARKMKQVNRGTYKPGMLAGKRSTPKPVATPPPKAGTSIDSISGDISGRQAQIRELSK